MQRLESCEQAGEAWAACEESREAEFDCAKSFPEVTMMQIGFTYRQLLTVPKSFRDKNLNSCFDCKIAVERYFLFCKTVERFLAPTGAPYAALLSVFQITSSRSLNFLSIHASIC